MKIVIAACRCGRWLKGKKNAHARAAARLAVDVNQAAARGDDLVNRGQTKSGSLVVFRGEKGFEGVGSCGRVHAGAIVFDNEERTRQRGPIEVRAFTVRENLHPAISGFDQDLSAVRHGVAGIEHQIENDLLRLGRIDLYEPERKFNAWAPTDSGGYDGQPGVKTSK